MGIAAAPAPRRCRPQRPGRLGPSRTVRSGPCTIRHWYGFDAQCGVVKVPVDYDRPNSDRVDLAVSRSATPFPTHSSRASCWSTPEVLVATVSPVRCSARSSLEAQAPALRSGSTTRGRLERGRAELHPGLLGYDRPTTWRTRHSSSRSGSAALRLCSGVCPHERPCVALDLTTLTRPGHRRHPPGAGPAADRLLRVLVRRLPRPGLRRDIPERVRRIVLDGDVDPRRVWSPSQLISTAPSTAPTSASTHRDRQYRDKTSTWRPPAGRSKPHYSVFVDLDAHPAAG